MAEPITTTSATVILPSPLQVLGTVFTIVLGWKISVAVIDTMAQSASTTLEKVKKDFEEKRAAKIAAATVEDLKKEVETHVPGHAAATKIIAPAEDHSKTLIEKMAFWKKEDSNADTVTAEDLVELATAPAK
jgi:predicted negative regulator of RcsB-dependent stress response